MVTIYVMMAPLGLVPRLLWMAVPGCFIVTLIFYGELSPSQRQQPPSPKTQASFLRTAS
jgi:hypothetical protein